MVVEVQDKIYGHHRISEPVLQELIQSDPVQRLKHIHQAGSQPYFTDKPHLMRFEHSLGVLILLQKHDASIDEQIAGLLHDTPHTVFSHLADFVFGAEEHEYHERYLEEVILESEIPQILDSYGFDTDDILDMSEFTLLEKDIPDICADRIDYFLRDLVTYRGESVDRFLRCLDTHNRTFVLEDKEIAEEFSLKYVKMDEDFWANPEEVTVNFLFGKAIERALETGLISKEALFESVDDDVYKRLVNSTDSRIEHYISELEDLDIVLDDEEYDFTVRTKCRWVDPRVLIDGGCIRVSEYSKRLNKRVTNHKKSVDSGYNIRIIDG